MRLLFGSDQLVAQWVAQQIPHMAACPQFPPCVATGVVDSQYNPVAGVVFYNHQPLFRTIEIACAANTHRWLTRSLIRGIMAYPFDQMKVRRVTALTARDNVDTRRFLEKFGFKLEGTARMGFGDQDAMLYGLLDTEWLASPWMKGLAVKSEPTVKVTRRRRRRRQIAPPIMGASLH